MICIRSSKNRKTNQFSSFFFVFFSFFSCFSHLSLTSLLVFSHAHFFSHSFFPSLSLFCYLPQIKSVLWLFAMIGTFGTCYRRVKLRTRVGFSECGSLRERNIFVFADLPKRSFADTTEIYACTQVFAWHTYIHVRTHNAYTHICTYKRR